MNGKIFKSVFFTSMLVLLISFLMIFSVLFSYFEEQVFGELENEADYIAYGLNCGTYEYLPVSKSKNKRITLIAPDGTVISDTAKATEELENHSSREEFTDASQNGFGRSARYSDTLTQKTLYYAVKLDNGNILRVSTTQNSVIIILLGLMQPIIIIITVALVLSLVFSYKVSSSIIKPINALNLDAPEENETYEELTPLLKKISSQNNTIRRQIREAEKTREEFRLICENMNEGFLVIDNRGKVLSHNTSALRLLNIDDISKNGVLTFNRTKNFREVVKKSLAGNHAESTLHSGDRTYNLIANPVCHSGRIIGSVIVIIDVTESAEREKLRREFTANVSHELKTPLTSISGFAEMMKSGGTPDDAVTDFSASIYDEAQRLISLVSDIIKISELDEGIIPADAERVNLYTLSNEIAKRLSAVAAENHISISVTGNDTYVMGNKKILDEMIYNLCDNSIKYNKPHGSVEIIISSENSAPTLTVKDTGIGIPDSECERVFERFYRVDKSRSKSAGGTGLGLAIVKHGAMYHNAKIKLLSFEGVGTEISLVFPIQ